MKPFIQTRVYSFFFSIVVLFVGLQIVFGGNSIDDTQGEGTHGGYFKKIFQACDGSGVLLGYSGSSIDDVSQECMRFADFLTKITGSIAVTSTPREEFVKGKRCDEAIDNNFLVGFTGSGEMLCSSNGGMSREINIASTTPYIETHTHWRVYFDSTTGSPYPDYAEVSYLEFMSTIGGANIIADGNMMAGNFVGGGGDGTTSAGFDTDSSRWIVFPGNTNRWLGYEFPSPVNIVQLGITTPGYAGNGTGPSGNSSFTYTIGIEYSDDGITWARAKTFTSNNIPNKTRTLYNID